MKETRKRKLSQVNEPMKSPNKSEFEISVNNTNAGANVLVCRFTSSDRVPKSTCILLLPCQSSVVFYGKAQIVHLFGPDINILGTRISMDSVHVYTIYSPNSHAPIVIRQQSSTEVEEYSSSFSIPDPVVLRSTLVRHFESSYVDSILGHIYTAFEDLQENLAVVLFSPHTCRVSDSVMRVKRFRHLYSLPKELNMIKNPDDSAHLGFTFMRSTDATGFRISQEMLELVRRLTRFDSVNSRLLICGPKGAGKSSLLRYCLNGILTNNQKDFNLSKSVAILDCDIGQPEFTPSGLVSLVVIDQPLLGPSFTHQLNKLNIVRQCFVGSVTPSNDPEFYLECLKYVYQAYVDMPEPRLPLIVNTMGWTQGLGLTLLLEQILMAKPTLVVQLNFSDNTASARLNLPRLDTDTLRSIGTWLPQDLSEVTFDHEVILMRSMARSYSPNDTQCQLGPPDLRDLMILTYFVSTLEYAYTSLPPRSSTESLGHPVSHLLDCVPYEVPIAYPNLIDQLPSSRKGAVSKVNEGSGETSQLMDENSSTSLIQGQIFNEESQRNVQPKPFQLAVRIIQANPKLFNPCLKFFPQTIDTVMACLNASLVALCAIPPELIQAPTRECPYPAILQNPVCDCFGFAICRAIDPTSGMLYLTTGVPEQDLRKVTGILRGDVNLPQCFFLEQPTFLPSNDEDRPMTPPYLGPADTQGMGRVGLPSKRSYPRTQHHHIHRQGTSETID